MILGKVRRDMQTLTDTQKQTSDGATADYYRLPDGATQLQDIISDRNMNGQIAEIFRACCRYGMVQHSPPLRDIKKIIFYAQAELARLEKLQAASSPLLTVGN